MKRLNTPDAPAQFMEFLREQIESANMGCILALSIGEADATGNAEAEGRMMTFGTPSRGELIDVLRALAIFATHRADELEGVKR